MLFELYTRTDVEAFFDSSSFMIIILYDSMKTLTKVKFFVFTDVDFELKNELIYHVKNKSRLCIFKVIKKNVFKLAHD